jgi:hypothetical protein
MRSSDYDRPQTGRKKYERNQKKSLKAQNPYGTITNCEILFLVPERLQEPETIRRCK